MGLVFFIYFFQAQVAAGWVSSALSELLPLSVCLKALVTLGETKGRWFQEWVDPGVLVHTPFTYALGK